jgi:hypothetical protein
MLFDDVPTVDLLFEGSKILALERRIYKYLAVPNSLVSCCKYLLLPLCHGRGREFESSPPFPSSTYSGPGKTTRSV